MQPAGEAVLESQAIAWAATRLDVPADRLRATVVDNPFFRSWRFFQVRDDGVPPRLITVATDGRGAQEVGLQSGFADQTGSEPVRLGSPEDAVDYVSFLLWVADPMIEILSSVDDTLWTSAEDRAAWREKVRPPAATRTGEGYSVESWLMGSGNLLRGRFSVDGQGRVRPELEVVGRAVGVPIAIL